MSYPILLALVGLLADGNLPEQPEPLLVAIVQLPEPGRNDAVVTLLDSRSGAERWSVVMRLGAPRDCGAYLQYFGTGLWVHVCTHSGADETIVLERESGKERFRVAGRYLGAPRWGKSRVMAFSTGSSGVVGICPDTGRLIWKRPDLAPTPQVGAMCGGHLVVPMRSELVGVHPATGADLWRRPYREAPLEENAGLLWFRGTSPIAIDPWTGAERRRLDPPENGRCVEIREGKAIFHTSDRLEAYRLSDGESIWSHPFPGQTLHLTTQLWQGVLYAGFLWKTHRSFLDAHTGRLLSSIELPEHSSSYSGILTRGVFRGWYGTSPTGARTLHLFDISRGRTLWSGEADAEWCSQSTGEVYARSGLHLYRVNPRHEASAWPLALRDRPWSQMAGRGYTVIAYADQAVSFDADSGGLNWKTALPTKATRGAVGAVPVR